MLKEEPDHLYMVVVHCGSETSAILTDAIRGPGSSIDIGTSDDLPLYASEVTFFARDPKDLHQSLY
jgi:hypothetical protein